MTTLTLEQAIENIYTSLNNENQDLDTHIAALKSVLAATAQKEVTVVPARLPQNNRQGRKMMQTYFRKRGVAVNFEGQSAGTE